jgi:hypothetical protein
MVLPPGWNADQVARWNQVPPVDSFQELASSLPRRLADDSASPGKHEGEAAAERDYTFLPGGNIRRSVSQFTELHATLGKNRGSSERSNLLQIISPEGEVMNKIAYLLQQAARAERLAKTTMDNLTVERLQTFAVECRTQAKALDAGLLDNLKRAIDDLQSIKN